MSSKYLTQLRSTYLNNRKSYNQVKIGARKSNSLSESVQNVDSNAPEQAQWATTIQLLKGRVWHKRTEQTEHRFEYPYTLLLLDLEKLFSHGHYPLGFSINKFNFLSFHEKDYLATEEKGLLLTDLYHLLEKNGLEKKPARIQLITAPRYLGYVFNPVSFFICLDEESRIKAVVAQVNNTFGDSHLYILIKECKVRAGFDVTYKVPKEFHVSPFFEIEGYMYEFSFRYKLDKCLIFMEVTKGTKKSFEAGFEGVVSQPSSLGFTTQALFAPLRGWLTFPRILLEATTLYFKKHLPVITRPAPQSKNTIVVRKPSLMERLSLNALSRVFAQINYGTIIFILPDNNTLKFSGTKAQEPEVTIKVHNYRFFRKLFLDGDVGAGESFERKDWECDNLVSLFTVIATNWNVFRIRSLRRLKIGPLLNKLQHIFRRNTISGSERNISAHYDLGNKMFELFLDRSLTYSAGYYKNVNDSLDQAQENKLDLIIDKAELLPTEHVLEIGCGWGSFAFRAAKRIGCKVTSITLSKQQYNYVNRQIDLLGLRDLVDVQYCDYRTVTGNFDKVISIEMIEAVGKENLPSYFASIDNVLKDGGKCVLQIITIPEKRRSLYGAGCDWIQKHIFPGCYVPSLEEVLQQSALNSSLEPDHIENIAAHYARTLKEWRERFDAKNQALKELGYKSNFLRKWHYYFAYCEAGFATHLLGTQQIVFTKTQTKYCS